MSKTWLVYAVAALVLGCHGEDNAKDDSPTLSKLVPASVSTTDAWRLFDRSVSSTFTPTNEHVVVHFERPTPLAAIKVFGPAPYRVALKRLTGEPLAAIDLSRVSSGWHTFPVSAASATDAVDLAFEKVGDGSIPEVEFWSIDDRVASRRAEVRQLETSLPIGFDSTKAVTDHADVAGSSCASFLIKLTRPPSVYRRTFLSFDAVGLLRGFSLRRSINGGLEQGGVWRAAIDGTRHLVDEVDPATLQLGDNTIKLCVPDTASRKVALSSFRVIGELDRGIDLVDEVIVGETRRPQLVDGDVTTTVDLASKTRVVLSFERLIAPDAIVIAGTDLGTTTVDCVQRTGTISVLETLGSETPTGLVLAPKLQGTCSSIGLSFDRTVKLGEIDVIGSGNEPVDWARLVVTSAREHFGNFAWVSGFVARPRVMTGAIRVGVDDQTSDTTTGSFGQLVGRPGATGPWSVHITAAIPDGTTQTRDITFDVDSRSTVATTATTPQIATTQSTPPTSRYGQEGDAVVGKASSGSAANVRLGTHIEIDVPAGAVANPTNITIRHLGEDVLPPLDPGMINVTAPRGHGYEFLPHGQKFARAVDVVVPFDEKLIPDGMTADDVHTFYFDSAAKRWMKLDRRAVDLGKNIIRSGTDHFTVMIDAVLAVPKNPSPMSMDPTSLSGIAAASPAANIDLIEPPQATSTGDANVGLPIRLPKGRGAYTPSLNFGYSSAAGNSWMGIGWDLTVSKVEIDTRFGVPTYADTEEPRYMLDGSQLVPTLETEGPQCPAGQTGRRYHPRVEGGFAHILRCEHPHAVDHARVFHFEVRDRSGTRYVYGNASTDDAATTDATLTSYDAPFGTFRWNLRRVIDTHANTTEFTYRIEGGTGSGEASRSSYPEFIHYTSHPSKPAAYKVEFVVDDASRTDKIVSGRPGFKTETRRLLRSVLVKLGDSSLIRQYVLTYRPGAFEKSVLSSIRVYGTNGCPTPGNAFVLPNCNASDMLDEHGFEYFGTQHGFDDTVAWGVS